MENSKVREASELVRHIFICGAKGLGNYGGYETFVDRLTEYHQDRSDIQYHIACKMNGDGSMDESRLSDSVQVLHAKRGVTDEFSYHRAHCFKVKVPPIGPAQAVAYDLLAIAYCLSYCKKNKIRKPVFYILACRIGPFIGLIRRCVTRLGGSLYVNPDGHEWKREKWSPMIRRYWKWSEMLMVRRADLLVCDSVNIERYIKKEYARYAPQTTYISYGTDLVPVVSQEGEERYASWLREKGLRKHEYYLIVGRFVPENSFAFMIRDFMRSSTQKDLAIITNVNDAFLSELEEELHFSGDSRIRFVGTVYDKELLAIIRRNAFAYLHGHTVGGTNPSLLEAMSTTDVNLLVNVSFNREVAGKAAFYWKKEQGDLAALIGRCETMTAGERSEMGRCAKERMRRHYSWEKICQQYLQLWRDGR